MKPALIPSFCSVKRMSVWLPLDGTLIHCRLAPSRFWYSFTYPRKMENWISLGGKEGYTNIQISAKLTIEPGTLWLECRDLTNCTNHAWLLQNKVNLPSITNFTCRNWLYAWQLATLFSTECMAVYSFVYRNCLVYSCQGFSNLSGCQVYSFFKIVTDCWAYSFFQNCDLLPVI